MKDYEIRNKDDLERLSAILNGYMETQRRLLLKFEGYQITVKKLTPDRKRTPPQLKLYWTVIREAKKAFREAGYRLTEDQVHQMFKIEGDLYDRVELENGTVIRTPKSLSGAGSITTKELADHLEFIKQWVAENLGYFIRENE